MAKKKRRPNSLEQDPYQAREARKYDNPIPSREFILDLLAEQGKPLNREQLAEQMKLSDEDQLEALRRRLRAMERDGQVLRNRRGGYCPVDNQELVAGRVIGHPDGFGFLKPDDGGDDLFLSPREMRALMHDDRVVARVTGIDHRGRREGGVVEILERGNQKVVGRLYCDHGLGFVVPDNKKLHQDIVIPEMDCSVDGSGEMVVVEIVEQPTRRSRPIGRIVEVLGEHMAPGMEIDVAIRSHNIPVEWPEAVEQEIAGLAPEVPEEPKQGRMDLRKLPLVTIDGSDARDFDDAVYCERKAKGWRLLVCIADVSHYVMPETALDKEAYQRGNSVYFPDRVIPMLPEVLSNGLCSLNPKVDRLCMTAELFFNDQGEMYRSRFFEAVMRSHARLIYDDVAAMLVDGDEALRKQHAKLLPHLQELHNLYKVLHASRATRGAIDFDTTETRIVFGENQKIEKVVPVVRNDAHRLIEECMLAANVAAARFLLRNKMPALYRNHETPPAEKLSDLREFLSELGLRLPGGDKPSAKDYADLLDSVQERPDTHLIQTVLLRSMAQAVYSAENKGHFGLAFAAYAHFTSPIRRYPDLMVHRAIRHLLRGGSREDFHYPLPVVQGMGEHCSTTERRADDATRDAVDWLKCEYMLDKVGDEFQGIISSVTSFGLFVQLELVHVDGLVHITALSHDYYHFDPIGHRLTGERSGQVFRLGDPIRVRVAAVNLDDRKIDFVLADGWVAPTRSERRRAGKSDDSQRRRKPRKAKAPSTQGKPENSKQKSSGAKTAKSAPKPKTKKVRPAKSKAKSPSKSNTGKPHRTRSKRKTGA